MLNIAKRVALLLFLFVSHRLTKIHTITKGNGVFFTEKTNWIF